MNSLNTPDTQGAREAAIEGMQRRATTRGFITPKLQKADPRALQLRWPHRLAFVSLNELRAGKSMIDAARIAGWRFFIVDTNDSAEPIAAAHVMPNERGELHLSELNEGPFVGSTMETMQEIIKQLETKSRSGVPIPDFELLLLLAPAVCFVSWWLRVENERDSLIFPVGPTIRGLDSDPIHPSKLLPALQEAFVQASRI